MAYIMSFILWWQYSTLRKEIYNLSNIILAQVYKYSPACFGLQGEAFFGITWN